MEGHVFVGHYCPVCKTSIGVMVVVGQEPRCPGCGGPLQATDGGPKQKVLANVSCKACGTKIGLLVGENGNCPACGSPLG